jgi:hypothetical protein
VSESGRVSETRPSAGPDRAARRGSDQAGRDQPVRRTTGSKRRVLSVSARFAGNAATAALARQLQDSPSFSDFSMGGQLVNRLYAGRATPEAAIMTRKVRHRTGKQVDKYASSHKFLKDYVAEKIKGGTKAEGNVHIHDAADFKTEWVAYAMSRTNPDTGALYTKAEAEAEESSTNAFRDGSEIHIHEERGEPGTAVHESMHLYSSDTYRDSVGSNANEGTTEYFTRMITTSRGIRRGRFYPDQLASVRKLVRASSKANLADGYFNGNLTDLKDDVEAKGKGNWASWKDYMKKGKYDDADALLK